MSSRTSDRCRSRQQDRSRANPLNKVRLNRKFLAKFSTRCVRGFLPGLDVPTGREPQTGKAMICEEHLASTEVDQYGIRNQMNRRNRWLLDSPEVSP
jgi:hypothetical protein